MPLDCNDLSLAKRVQFEVLNVPENVCRSHENGCPLQAKQKAGAECLSLGASDAEDWEDVILNLLLQNSGAVS